VRKLITYGGLAVRQPASCIRARLGGMPFRRRMSSRPTYAEFRQFIR